MNFIKEKLKKMFPEKIYEVEMFVVANDEKEQNNDVLHKFSVFLKGRFKWQAERKGKQVLSLKVNRSWVYSKKPKRK